LDQQQADRPLRKSPPPFAAAQRDALQRQSLIGRRDRLKIELDGAHAHLGATQAVEQAQAEYDEAAAAAGDAQNHHHHAVEEVAARESDYISAQASVLAERLEDGVPCPVCGGSDHPLPAHGTGDAGLLEKAWRAAQSASVAAAKIDREAQSRASSAKATLDERQATLSGLDVPQRGASEIEIEYRHSLAAINELGSIVDLTLLAKEVDDLRDRKLMATATKLQQANSTSGRRNHCRSLVPPRLC
jgi:exonuclease SbcC